MTEFNTIRSIIIHIFQHRLLRSFMLISLSVPVFIFLRSYFLVLPQFSEKLLIYSEEESQRTASHLTKHFITLDQDQIVINKILQSNTNAIMAEFGLEKIKLFSKQGRILFSSSKEDIGKMNEHAYFHQIVAKGEMFSKIVNKNHKTLEGRVVARDVAEIYIPIKYENTFIGAFELYYDLTERKEELDALFKKEAYADIVISLILIGIVLIMVFHTSRAILKEKAAKAQLKTINQNLEQIVAAKTRELQVTQKTAIESLAVLAEYHDMDTGGHLTRIRYYTELIATTLLEDSPYSTYLHNQGKEKYIQELVMASTLHDIGKTAISKEILCMKNVLSIDKFEELKKHTIIAWDALNQGNEIFVKRFGKDSYLSLAGNIALYHHEKWDGTGYPTRLKGEDIPLSARIVSLADVYDALRSKRTYKEPWSHAKTTEFIINQSG
ncbi:MAG: HD domain-containing protein, partial [Proteobacteria bacterium]|nr:HD domain-containing protein [Pseudomonadota bacterium]